MFVYPKAFTFVLCIHNITTAARSSLFYLSEAETYVITYRFCFTDEASFSHLSSVSD